MNKLPLFFCAAILTLSCGDAISSEKCTANMHVRLIDRVTENALGAVREMGIFKLVNRGNSAITVLGWRRDKRFFVEYPDSWLEAGTETEGWHRLSPWWIEDGEAPHEKLVLVPGMQGDLHYPLITAKSPKAKATDKIRLHLTLSDHSCVISEPFSNPYKK